MNHMKLLPALFVVSLVLIALSGCTGTNTQTTTNPLTDGSATGAVTAPTSQSLAQELSSGTGTGSNDITTNELDDIQNDLDEIDIAADASEESNI